MNLPKSEFFSVLRQYNPWWENKIISDLPTWKRAAFQEIQNWSVAPPGGRALLLSGARQIGKTTLFLQTIQNLLKNGVPSKNILYATFDHPLLKLLGLDGLISLWKEFEPPQEGVAYLFLDEIQSIKNWQTWIKHQIDFEKKFRIALTGSSTPVTTENLESGVGRWQTVRLGTLSFFEFLQIQNANLPSLPQINSFQELFQWTPQEFIKSAQSAIPLLSYFNDYLLRGGFPQMAQVETISLAQKLLREDIVDKVLKRDMTAFFGVRRILELEQLFIYLCLHDGSPLDIKMLCSSLELQRPTVENFIYLLEASHLIHKLMPYGYKKEILRARSKIYLSDAAISPSVLLRGKNLLENPSWMGRSVETAFFKHLYTRYYQKSIGFSYWKGTQNHEVDFIADLGDRLVPFEVKYRDPDKTTSKELRGLEEFSKTHGISKAYIITKELQDFSFYKKDSTHYLKIPVSLACYWLGSSEIQPLTS